MHEYDWDRRAFLFYFLCVCISMCTFECIPFSPIWIAGICAHWYLYSAGKLGILSALQIDIPYILDYHKFYIF